MPRHKTLEQRSWWPDALQQLEHLAASGVPKTRAAKIVGAEFGVSESGIWIAIERGSVPAYPSRHPARARAWKAGEVTYEGDLCQKHGTRTRYSNDGICLGCMADDNSRARAAGYRRISR